MVSQNQTIKLSGIDWLKIAGFLIIQVGGLLGYAEKRLAEIDSRLTVLETRRTSDTENDAKTLQILNRIEANISTMVEQFHSVDKRLTVIESKRLGPQGGQSP